MNFCAAIVTLRVEAHGQHFHHIVRGYFKEGKTQLTPEKKVCAVCTEKALGLLARIRGGLRSSDPCWRFLPGRCSVVGAPAEGDSDQTETFIENDQRSSMRETADILRYPDQGSYWRMWKKCGFSFMGKRWAFRPARCGQARLPGEGSTRVAKEFQPPKWDTRSSCHSKAASRVFARDRRLGDWPSGCYIVRRRLSIPLSGFSRPLTSPLGSGAPGSPPKEAVRMMGGNYVPTRRCF